MTPAQGRRWKRELERENRRAEKRAARERLASLRLAIREAREARRLAAAQARLRCKAARLAARARARELRARMLSEMRVAVAAARSEARSACDVELERARELGTKREQARAAFEAERAFQREIRRIERWNRAKEREARALFGGRAGAAVRRGESDDEVLQNIPPELAALFERVKSRIRGSDRMSRTEAFLEYAEEHPGEALEAMGDPSDRVIADLEARAEEEARRAAGRRARRRPPTTAPAADEVPF